MIPVTRPYLPNRDKLKKYIDVIYESQWLTNNGPLVQELTDRLEQFLGVDNLLLVSNGTLALQIAYRALGISQSSSGECPEAITTPFTFIATASSLKWDGIQPVFADIDSDTWCLNAANIESVISSNTRAIVPVHVFGNACDVDAIQAVADKHDLTVVYDASHAFGVQLDGQSLLKHGDASTLSFHATKLFHTVEGGAIVFNRKEDLERAKRMINFGIAGPEHIEEIGINAKMNELQAAMGLCVLDEIEENLKARESVWRQYESELKRYVQLQVRMFSVSHNYAYFPVVFSTEDQATYVAARLKERGVLARRYFYPSLETVDVLGAPGPQSVSHDIAKRILCLPIYAELKAEAVSEICRIVIESLRE